MAVTKKIFLVVCLGLLHNSMVCPQVNISQFHGISKYLEFKVKKIFLHLFGEDVFSFFPKFFFVVVLHLWSCVFAREL